MSSSSSSREEKVSPPSYDFKSLYPFVTESDFNSNQKLLTDDEIAAVKKSLLTSNKYYGVAELNQIGISINRPLITIANEEEKKVDLYAVYNKFYFNKNRDKSFHILQNLNSSGFVKLYNKNKIDDISLDILIKMERGQVISLQIDEPSEEKSAYVIEKYISGIKLSEIIKKGLAPVKCFDFAILAINEIQKLHANLFAHGQVSTDNFLYNPRERPALSIINIRHTPRYRDDRLWAKYSEQNFFEVAYNDVIQNDLDNLGKILFEIFDAPLVLREQRGEQFKLDFRRLIFSLISKFRNEYHLYYPLVRLPISVTFAGLIELKKIYFVMQEHDLEQQHIFALEYAHFFDSKIDKSIRVDRADIETMLKYANDAKNLKTTSGKQTHVIKTFCMAYVQHAIELFIRNECDFNTLRDVINKLTDAVVSLKHHGAFSGTISDTVDLFKQSRLFGNSNSEDTQKKPLVTSRSGELMLACQEAFANYDVQQNNFSSMLRR